ncbi:hypothetical protein Nepgr_003853 [Nepenthes gracilis]|uniref:Uncharacterized protein n=1 Tax=Nepenthes gracilis TaxID=150966 RepID=A0AAD3S0E7_NEPGR|nr:hypothetical protein Nepgr_003853 [Nepenthes gracilis]
MNHITTQKNSGSNLLNPSAANTTSGSRDHRDRLIQQPRLVRPPRQSKYHKYQDSTKSASIAKTPHRYSAKETQLLLHLTASGPPNHAIGYIQHGICSAKDQRSLRIGQDSSPQKARPNLATASHQEYSEKSQEARFVDAKDAYHWRPMHPLKKRFVTQKSSGKVRFWCFRQPVVLSRGTTLGGLDERGCLSSKATQNWEIAHNF